MISEPERKIEVDGEKSHNEELLEFFLSPAAIKAIRSVAHVTRMGRKEVHKIFRGETRIKRKTWA
jgi:hypothetical protein